MSAINSGGRIRHIGWILWRFFSPVAWYVLIGIGVGCVAGAVILVLSLAVPGKGSDIQWFLAAHASDSVLFASLASGAFSLPVMLRLFYRDQKRRGLRGGLFCRSESAVCSAAANWQMSEEACAGASPVSADATMQEADNTQLASETFGMHELHVDADMRQISTAADAQRVKGDAGSFRLAVGRTVIPVASILLGAGACVVVNVLIALSGLTALAPESQSSQALYSGALWLQIVVAGLLLPVVEELVFRALCFRRLREEFGPLVCAICSATLFALFHGDLVSGVYAFVIGLLLAWVYECSGVLYAPMLLHISANLMSLWLSQQLVSGNMNGLAAVVLLLCSAVAVAVGFVLLHCTNRYEWQNFGDSYK